MRIDLRAKHDVETRRHAAELFDSGMGSWAAPRALSVPRGTVRQWLRIYRAFGSEALLTMDGKQIRCTYEQKVAAASAVVDGGATKTEAMAEFGIMSMAPLDRWCRLYREGGVEALRPKGSKVKLRELTREQEVEECCRRLEAEVAYLKNDLWQDFGHGSSRNQTDIGMASGLGGGALEEGRHRLGRHLVSDGG